LVVGMLAGRGAGKNHIQSLRKYVIDGE